VKCPDCGSEFQINPPVAPAAMHSDRSTVIVWHHQETKCSCGERFTTVLLEIPSPRFGFIKCKEQAESPIITMPGLVRA